MQRKILIISVFLLTAALVGGFALGGTVRSGGLQLAAASSDRSGDVSFPLEGSQEVPPVTTESSGACDGSLNVARTEFSISCNHNAPAVAAHIHKGEAGTNGPIVFFLDTATTFSFVVNEQTLADQPSQATPISFADFLRYLDSGALYVNVHSMANPGGEIRGQIPAPPSNLYFATFGNGDGITSDIVLLNSATTGDPVTGVLTFYDESGTLIPIGDLFDGGMTEPSGVPTELAVEIPPSGSVTLSTSGSGPQTVGAVRVTSSEALGGVIRFDIDGLGVAGVGSSQLYDTALAPVRNTPRIQTGLAMFNASEEAVNVTMSLRGPDGLEVDGGIGEVVLGPRASVSNILGEYFPDADLQDFNGTVLLRLLVCMPQPMPIPPAPCIAFPQPQPNWPDVAYTALEFGIGVFTALPVVPAGPPDTTP